MLNSRAEREETRARRSSAGGSRLARRAAARRAGTGADDGPRREELMPISIVVPQLGESVAEGTVARWLKAQGDRVRKEEPLVEIQTDKINVEIPSPAEGTLSQILVAEGTTVLVGTEIAQLLGARRDRPERPPARRRSRSGARHAAPARRSAPVAANVPAAPRPAPFRRRPRVRHRFRSRPRTGNGDTQMAERNLSPAVRKIMREQGVALDEVGAIRGSGIAGRVTRDDLLGYLSQRVARPAVASAPAFAAPAAPAMPTAAPAPAAAPASASSPRR